MIVDKDSGKVYDSRNELHVGKLTNNATTSNNVRGSEIFGQTTNSNVERKSAWGDWWKKKK